MDRACASEAQGRGFEPLRARQFLKLRAPRRTSKCFCTPAAFFLRLSQGSIFCETGHPPFDREWENDDLLDFDDVIVDPLKDLSEAELSTGDRTHHKFKSRDGFDGQVESANKKKRMRGGKGDALVSVEKRVIVRQGFQESRRFLGHTVVIAGLRAEYRGFQQTTASNTIDPTVLIDLLFVDCENFGDGEVDTLWHLAHFASF